MMTHTPHLASCNLSWSGLSDDSLAWLREQLGDPTRWPDGTLTAAIAVQCLSELKRRQVNADRDVPREADLVRLDLNAFSAADFMQGLNVLDEATRAADTPADCGRIFDRIQGLLSCATGAALVQTVQQLAAAEARIRELEGGE